MLVNDYNPREKKKVREEGGRIKCHSTYLEVKPRIGSLEQIAEFLLISLLRVEEKSHNHI